MSEWIPCSEWMPSDGQVVMTKIDDVAGCRNEQELVKQRNLWFYPDFSMYVYYRPTHWRINA